MTETLATNIYNFFILNNRNMDIYKYNKLSLLHDNIKSNTDKYVNMAEWNSLYIRNTNIIPETPPNKSNILKSINNILTINYLDLIHKYYNIIDSTNNIKTLTSNNKNDLLFIIFILTKQPNILFIIDTNSWNSIRSKCLIGKPKTKMPRNPISIKELIQQINSVLSLL